MASSVVAARVDAAEIFRALTGRLFGYDPLGRIQARRTALSRAKAWWKEHAELPRTEWIRSLFEDSGITIERLGVREAVPALVTALGEDDPNLHEMALRQLTRITGKYFTRDRPEVERVWAVGWLRARGWLSAEDER